MFNTFKNSNLAYYLYTVFVIVLGIGSLIFFYFMVTGFNIGVYQQNTLVGSVYVGGLSSNEAERKIRDHINQWYEDDSVVFEVGFQGYYYAIDRELFTFDVQGSVDNIRDGARNPLIVELSPTAVNNIDFELHAADFMQGMDGLFDFDLIVDALLEDAAALRQFSRKQLNHYVIDEAQLNVTVSEVMFPLPGTMDANTILDKLEERYPDHRVPIASHSIFSVFEQFPETLNSNELSIIGTMLLDLITPTTLEIYERHYNPQIGDVHTSPFIGRNVRINRHEMLNYDFRFENDSFLDYSIEFYHIAADQLGARLIGPANLDTIEITREEIILDYIPAPDGATIIEEGQQGKVIFIHRHVYNIYEMKTSNHLLIFEYYEPLDPVIAE